MHRDFYAAISLPEAIDDIQRRTGVAQTSSFEVEIGITEIVENHYALLKSIDPPFRERPDA
ncbi:hypothetical protein HF325_001106 [Metschnikowia pulcherrima]|uniref:Uncharacterized protein n=1 Tax=Metschnikowia pulcherrima TaxID=27326 RepID=A0A8H7LDB4_9ASCO|nr:hypothetical protein HF325_001106 [Metschnikowia pulcherrima]